MSDSLRIIPRQERAHTSRACILEATAQLLNRKNVGSITTNHVAERAGVSIGTLYRYFRDKDDIFDTLAKSEIAATTEKGFSLLQNEKITSGNILIGEFSDVAIDIFNNRPLVRRNLHEIIGKTSYFQLSLHLRRLRFSRMIGEKLVQLEPERFRVLQRDERACLVMAWRAIVNETLADDMSKLHREHIKRLLVGTVLSFSLKDP